MIDLFNLVGMYLVLFFIVLPFYVILPSLALETFLLLPLGIMSSPLLVSGISKIYLSCLPELKKGKYKQGERYYVLWLLRKWPSLAILRLFQSFFFANPYYRYFILKSLGSKVFLSTIITGKTIMSDPELLEIGKNTVIGEFAHLGASYFPNVNELRLGKIIIGNNTLIASHVVIGTEVSIGDEVIINAGVDIMPLVRIGDRVKIGGRSVLYSGVVIPSDTDIPPFTHVKKNYFKK